MAGLLEPYIPDSSKWFKSAEQGYALGDTMRNRDLLVNAGGQMAQGNLKGARNTLYAGGNLDDGGKIDARLRADAQAAKTEQLQKAAKFQAMMGELAQAADTPEKWAKAIGTAQKMGIDVGKYADFGARDIVLAQSGKVGEMLKMELERRKVDRSQPAYDFTKTGVGNKFTGEFKPYAAGEAGADPELTLEQGKYEQGLRKEYTGLTSELRSINDSYGRMKSVSSVNSGAGDIAMVYSYMKMLDPTSVVREGEYATAENTGGIPEKISNVYNKIISGQRLTPEQRRQFLESADVLAKDKVERFGKMRSQFEGIAKKSGADPARIMLDEGIGGNTGGGGNQGGGAPPDEAVRMLRSNSSPEMRRYFDETFGAGASQRALGQ